MVGDKVLEIYSKRINKKNYLLVTFITSTFQLIKFCLQFKKKFTVTLQNNKKYSFEVLEIKKNNNDKSIMISIQTLIYQTYVYT